MSDAEFRALELYRRELQQPCRKTTTRNPFSFFKSSFLAENETGYRRNKPVTRAEFFGLDKIDSMVAGVSNTKADEAAAAVHPVSVGRKRSFSIMNEKRAAESSSDYWLRKLNDDLDSLVLLVVPRYDLKGKLDSRFRDQLTQQVAQWRTKYHGLNSRVFHLSACGTLFSTCCSLLFDTGSKASKLAQSKTEIFQPKLADTAVRIEPTVPVKEFVPFSQRTTERMRLQNRADKMQNMTEKMFSPSREGEVQQDTPTQNGKVSRLSEKFETWQRVRSASASPTPIPALVGPKFTYMNTSLHSAWITRHGQGVHRSRSIPRTKGSDNPYRRMSTSKTFHENSPYTPKPISAGRPRRHVGFDLLEASLNFDDKISVVSSFHGSSLDDFRLSPSSCHSSDMDYLKDDILPIPGPDVQQMASEIDRISAPPAKKPLSETGTLSRKISFNDAAGTHYFTPARSKSFDRQKSGQSDYEDDFDLIKEYQRIDEIYEKEREKRQKKKEQEDERRRHNYFTPVAPSLVQGDRYDSVYEDPFELSRRPGRPRSVSPGVFARNYGRSNSANSDYQDNSMLGPARAVYAFRAQNPMELSFRQGDIVRVTKVLDANWVEGECLGKTGIAPSSYLENVRQERLKQANRNDFTQGRAKYDFNAQNSVEMSLKKGEIALIIRRVDQNWYEGKTGPRRGIFPVSYVEILRPESSAGSGFIPQYPSSSAPNKPQRQTSPQPSSSNLRRKSSTTVVAEGSDRGRFGDKVLDEFKSQVAVSPTPMAQLRRNSAPLRSSIDELLIPPPPTTSLQQELDLMRREPERCRVLYSYKSQNDDEMSLMEGEIITIIEKCDDGWFRGANKHGDQGYFPGNYVQVSVS